MIRSYKKTITSGTRYPKEFIDECAKICFWVRGYNRGLHELGKDETIPKMSSFLKADMEGSEVESTRLCNLRCLYNKCLLLEDAMCEIEVASENINFADCLPIEISMSEISTYYAPIKFVCKVCDQPFRILQSRELLKALEDHHTYHNKISCEHKLVEQSIAWDIDDYGSLEITNVCGCCGKTLEGYATNIEDIKELLFNTLSSTPHPKINKKVVE